MKPTAPLGRYHTIIKQRVASKHSTVIPVLYLRGDCGLFVMWSLVDYFVTFSSKSSTWQQNVARSVGLFYDYAQARKSDIESKEKILKYFVRDLRFGTVGVETHSDPTGLYWAPSSLNVVKRLIGSLKTFISWVEIEQKENAGLSTFIRKCDTYEDVTIKALIAGRSIAKFSIMEHIKDPKNIARELTEKQLVFGYSLGSDPLNSLSSIREYKRFPTELIAPMLEYGFIKNNASDDPFEREDITAKMIFILLVHCGLRRSEPLHLWVCDVNPLADTGCRVTLYHPSFAPTKIHGEHSDRKLYLLKRNLRPRNDNYNNKSYKAGWKNLAVDTKQFSADVFFIHESSQAIFGELYILYLNRYRKSLMQKYINNNGTDHPFLFVSSGRDQNTGKSYEGSPYSMAAFEKAYNKALDRIEIRLNRIIPRGKESHMNPHCLRHHYAKAMSEAGVEDQVIQKALHHRTINSQEAYKGISSDQVREALSIYSVSTPAFSRSKRPRD